MHGKFDNSSIIFKSEFFKTFFFDSVHFRSTIFFGLFIYETNVCKLFFSNEPSRVNNSCGKRVLFFESVSTFVTFDQIFSWFPNCCLIFSINALLFHYSLLFYLALLSRLSAAEVALRLSRLSANRRSNVYVSLQLTAWFLTHWSS